MKIFRIGIDNIKSKEFHTKREYAPYCTFQLFQSDTKLIQNGKTITVPKNSIILFSPASEQNFKSAEALFKNSFVVFSATEKEQKQLTFDTPVKPDNPTFFYNILRLLYDEFYSTTEHGASVEFLLKALLEKTKEIYTEVPLQPHTNKEITIHNLRAEILGCAQFDWDIGEIANTCHMSTSRFHVMYKQKYGISPMADIRQHRISIAQSLLRTTDKSIQEIAEASGYQSIAYFSRHFKKATGMSPSEFRKASI